jgi:hypothetical protein
MRVIYPAHLNPKVRSTIHALLGGTDRIHLTEPLDYITFVVDERLPLMFSEVSPYHQDNRLGSMSGRIARSRFQPSCIVIAVSAWPSTPRSVRRDAFT